MDVCRSGARDVQEIPFNRRKAFIFQERRKKRTDNSIKKKTEQTTSESHGCRNAFKLLLRLDKNSLLASDQYLGNYVTITVDSHQKQMISGALPGFIRGLQRDANARSVPQV